MSKFRTALPIITLIASMQAHCAEIEIPRSVPGDKGRYFLMEQKSNNGITSTLHRREGPSGTGYTKAEIDCKNNKMRDIAYADEDIKKMIHNPSKWYDLVEGSSKSDLFHFVCKK
jgi:hypothetical protein